MKRFNTLLIASLLVAVVNAPAIAQTVDYKILINDIEAAVYNLTPGTHTVKVQARVTDNDLGGGFSGGLFQSAFNLSTNNDSITWDDAVGGGFIGTSPDGNWDSMDLIPPFDTHFRGQTTNGGGPNILAETHAVAPGNYTSKFNLIGDNVFSLVAQGNFVWNGTDTTLSLDVVNPLTGDIVVAGVNASQAIIGMVPEIVNETSVMITGGTVDPNNAAPVLQDDPLQPTGLNRTFMHQFTVLQDDDLPTPGLTWAIDMFSGGPMDNAPSIDADGKFSWNTTGAQGGGTVYTAVVRATDNGGLFDTTELQINVPEPGAFILAGLSLIGIVTSRRRLT